MGFSTQFSGYAMKDPGTYRQHKVQLLLEDDNDCTKTSRRRLLLVPADSVDLTTQSLLPKNISGGIQMSLSCT